MAELTPNLNLFKYDPITDVDVPFSIEQAMNDNWDILDDLATKLGGNRNIGEIVASSLPLTDAGLHLLDGALINGSGIYSAFVDYIADIYSNIEILYAWGVGSQAVYTKTVEPTVGVTPLYNSDGEELVGYTITQVTIDYTSIEYSISGDTTLYGRSRAEKADIYSKIFTNETQWQKSVTTYGVCGKFVYTEEKPALYAWTNYTSQGEPTYYLKHNYMAVIGENVYNYDGTVIGTVAECSSDATGNYFTTYIGGMKFYKNPDKNLNAIPATVRLPKITGILEGTTDLNALGNLVEAGLPNITGSISTLIPWTSASGTGALYSTSMSYNFVNGTNSQTVVNGIYVDASRSNPIYGNSLTVQPQAIKCFVYIVIATSSKTDIQVDIDEITTDLNRKLDTDLSNISASQSAKSEIISWGLPDWNNKISLSTNNVVNTIPCLGYVHLNTRTASPGGTWNMKINDNFVATWFNNNTYGYGGFAFIPVKQGDTTVISASNLGDGATYEFIPMKGAN